MAAAPVEVIVAGSSHQGCTTSVASHPKSDLPKLASGMVPTHVMRPRSWSRVVIAGH
jgi:hypothetical protein